MIETVALVVAAVALGLAAFAVWLALDARGTARQAIVEARALVAASARARSGRHTSDRRQDDEGPPAGEPERRRHRAPEDAPRARRSEVDDPQWSTAPTEQIAAARPDPATVEHPAPRRPGSGPDLRRPPPPLPPPGTIPGRPA